jgi:hypothetical protein
VPPHRSHHCCSVVVVTATYLDRPATAENSYSVQLLVERAGMRVNSLWARCMGMVHTSGKMERELIVERMAVS